MRGNFSSFHGNIEGRWKSSSSGWDNGVESNGLIVNYLAGVNNDGREQQLRHAL